MILYFANRDAKIIGHATTSLRSGYIISNDRKKQSIATGTTVFSCTISFSQGSRETIEEMTQAGNYIFLHGRDDDFIDNDVIVSQFFNIITSDFNTMSRTVDIYAEDAGLDLLNCVCPAVNDTGLTKNIKDWINYFFSGYGWQIGDNEIGLVTTRALYWDSESSGVERLLSIADAFNGCEISYSFKIKGFKVLNKYINIYLERGEYNGEKLRMGHNVSNIIIQTSVANVTTALCPTGEAPKNSDVPITLKNYSNTYECTGNIYCEGGTITCMPAKGYVICSKAMKKWSGILDSDGLLVRRFSYDTAKQATLFNRAALELKKDCYQEVNFSVELIELPRDVKIGDRVDLIDDEGELYISTRLLEIEESETSNKTTIIIGENKIKKSGISSKVERLANEFVQLANTRTLYLWIVYTNVVNPTIENISLTPRTGDKYIGVLPNQTNILENISQIEEDDLSYIRWSEMGSQGESAISVKLTSSEGIIFKNKTPNTDLRADVIFGTKNINSMSVLRDYFGEQATLKWYVNNVLITESDSRLLYNGMGFRIIQEASGGVPPTLISSTSDIRCELWF